MVGHLNCLHSWQSELVETQRGKGTTTLTIPGRTAAAPVAAAIPLLLLCVAGHQGSAQLRLQVRNLVAVDDPIFADEDVHAD